MPPADPHQFDLFDHRPVHPPRDSGRIGPAAPQPEHVQLAARLPANVRFGTSSWSFPGWRGLVYDRAASPADLARDGLTAYARHPLLRAVGLDRTYYAPLPPADYARFAASVPDDFRFLVKCHDAVTSLTPVGGTSAPAVESAASPANAFLDPDYAAQTAVTPCVEGLADKLGVIVFQFSRMFIGDLGGPRAFLDRLHQFLRRLPAGVPYAVELRNRTLLTPEYAALLRDAGATHCYNVHPDALPLAQQVRLVPPSAGQPVCAVRWMLHPTLRYEPARERYAPFDALVDEDPPNRAAVRDLVLAAATRGLPVITIANNKAEGAAPLTCFKLAQAVVDATTANP